jgi:hypothetical protein
MQAIAVYRDYQCTSTDLIKAHIIPACFAREIMGSHRHNPKISLIAKIDRRPLPAGFHFIVANRRTKLNGPFVPHTRRPKAEPWPK